MAAKILKTSQLEYKEIIKEVSFTWRQGESIALMGANGSGKSTLAKLIVGLLDPTKGNVYLYEDQVAEEQTHKPDRGVHKLGCRSDWEKSDCWKEVAYIGQHPRRQTIGATVAEELSFGLMNLGLCMPEVKRRVRELILDIGLAGKENTSPANLSGGERQRLVVAAVLAMEPAFLILDEALTMLDTMAQTRILGLLQKNNNRMGQLWITHDPEMAVNADRLLLLKDGLLYESGEPSKVLANRDIRREFGIRGFDFFSQALKREKQRSGECHKEVLKWENVHFNNRLKIDKIVTKGEFIGIIGPSGAGKSTLLESAASLLNPDQGQVLVFGESVRKTRLGGIRNGIRLLLQEAGEYIIGSTVFKEVFYEPPRLRNIISKLIIPARDTGHPEDPKHKMKERVSYLRKMGIPVRLINYSPEQLSGGERQRVALAAVLQTSPAVLLLDEPMLGLDAFGRKMVNRFIYEFDQNITVLFVTHDLRDVLPSATRLWLVREGEVVLDCPAYQWEKYTGAFREAGVRC